jgi:hypothetical protein
MRASLAAIGILLSSFVSAPLLAQQSDSPPKEAPTSSDPQATALFERAFAALSGGVTVSDATLTGTVARTEGSDNETGTVVLKATSSGDSRIDLSFPSGSPSEIRNHAATPSTGSLPPGISQSDLPHGVQSRTPPSSQPAGAWFGSDGSRHAMASHNAMSEPTWFLPAVTFARLRADQTLAVSFAGEETHNDRQVLHLSISVQPPEASSQITAFLRHLSQMEAFLDPATFLPASIIFNTHPETNAALDIPTEIRFSDYRPVNGVEVPFHVQRYANNSLVLDIRIESVTLDSGIASSAFAIQ